MKDKAAKVEAKWKDLEAAAKDRREKLEGIFSFLFLSLFFFPFLILSFLHFPAAALSQEYYSAADDAEHFIHEKEPLLDTTDLGQDEDAALALLKKHQALADELDSYEFDINALRDLSKVGSFIFYFIFIIIIFFSKEQNRQTQRL